MNPTFVPSLQHIALAKISVLLCNNHKIKTLLEKNGRCNPPEVHDGNYLSMLEMSRYPEYHNPTPHHDVGKDILEEAQNKVSGMISPLNLGSSFEKKILNFIPHIILEIEKWKEDHSQILPYKFDAQVYFCWKSVGIIDRESTAENLLNHGNLNVKNRFFLACWHCMENCLSSLWDRIYDAYKAHLISRCHSGSLLNYWISRLDGLPSKKCVFPEALYITNLSALRYFYNACDSEDEKEALLNNVLSKRWKNVDLVQFCVLKLCQNGHEQLSSLQCRNILKCFLNWPLQSLFLDMSMHLIANLNELEINALLYDILRILIKHQYEDIDYLNLLKELWEQVPICHKDALVNTFYFQPIKTALQETSAKSLTPEWFYQEKMKCNIL